jgi:hypothetical protein
VHKFYWEVVCGAALSYNSFQFVSLSVVHDKAMLRSGAVGSAICMLYCLRQARAGALVVLPRCLLQCVR